MATSAPQTQAPQKETRPATSRASSESSTRTGSSGSVQLKRRLVGLSYEQQAKMLAPPADGGPGGGADDVQLHGGDGAGDVHAAAAHGVSGGGGALPHLGNIQKSFGHHDVSGVSAHVGGKAAEATRAMGAEAYATGDSVAFGGSPSLHTAAHEAAHVVQQRAGVSLSGGVGKAGDGYERHADAVADTVVRGDSAAPLLDQMVGGSKADAGVQRKAGVQFYAGNTENATTHQGEGSVGEQVAENHGESPAAERDGNFNPALKVEFEVKLGRALIHARGFYDDVVKSVSMGIFRYLQAKAETLEQSEQQVLQQAYESMSFMYGDNLPNVFYGRITDSLGDKDKYYGQMTSLLEGGAGTVQNHMLAHQCFLDKVLDGADGDIASGGAERYFDRMRAKAQEAGDEQHAQAKNPDLKHLRKSGDDEFGLNGPGVNNMTARGRLNSRKGGTAGFNKKKGGLDATSNALPPGVRYDERISDNSLRAGESIGISDRENAGDLPALNDKDREQGLGQEHSRGIEQYTLDESQKFIQDARVKHNMPLAAGISGTTTDLHEVAKMMGVSGPLAEFKYQLACLAHLQTAGAHSFHEIMAAAALNTQVSYEPGNYRSILRYGVGQIPEIQALFADPKYAAIPGIGDPSKLGGRTTESTGG